MKKINWLLGGITLALFGCQGVESSEEGTATFSMTNPSSSAQENVLVTLPRSSFPKETGDLLPVMYLGIDTLAGQHDDLDGDGKWDEFSVLVSLPADTTYEFHLGFQSKEHLPAFTKRTWARLAMAEHRDDQFVELTAHTRPKDHIAGSRPMLYQFEGVGFENDKVAFRSYFDNRNGKDIFGKRVPDMLLDQIGAPGTHYHELADWGMDVLKVGISLGAGALAIKLNDTIYRLGETEVATYELIATGPVRTILELRYEGWHVGGKSLNAVERITMTPGNYCYQSDFTIEGDLEPGSFSIVTGVVNMKDTLGLKSQQHGTLYESHFTLSAQSENHDVLGMGILAESENLVTVSESDTVLTDGITDSYLFELNPDADKHVRYYFFAGWELSDTKFTTQAGMREEIDGFAKKLQYPIEFKLKP